MTEMDFEELADPVSFYLLGEFKYHPSHLSFPYTEKPRNRASVDKGMPSTYGINGGS